MTLIPLKKVLFEKLIVPELVKKSSDFYGTERESAGARHARGLHSARKNIDVTSAVPEEKKWR